jgi:hypothetical protein
MFERDMHFAVNAIRQTLQEMDVALPATQIKI